MRKIVRSAIAAASVVVGTTGALAGTAYAGTTTTTTPAGSSAGAATLAAIKDRAAAAIQIRLASLDTATSAVNSNTVITSSDKTALLATLNGDTSGLTLLGPKIQGDTTPAQALADYKTIFTTYRVYALALPQVRFAEAADDLTGGVVPRLTDAQSKLAGLLSGVDSGKDTPAVQAEMTDLGQQISAITSSLNGLSATVLAYTPAQYDANPAILSTPKQTLQTAHGDAKSARQDIANVLGALK